MVCFSEEELCDTGMGATLIVGTRPLLVASYSAMVTPLNGRLSSTVMLGLRIRSGFRIESCQLDVGLVLPVVFFLVPDFFVRKLFRSRHDFIGRSRSPNMSEPKMSCSGYNGKCTWSKEFQIVEVALCGLGFSCFRCVLYGLLVQFGYRS